MGWRMLCSVPWFGGVLCFLCVGGCLLPTLLVNTNIASAIVITSHCIEIQARLSGWTFEMRAKNIPCLLVHIASFCDALWIVMDFLWVVGREHLIEKPVVRHHVRCRECCQCFHLVPEFFCS